MQCLKQLGVRTAQRKLRCDPGGGLAELPYVKLDALPCRHPVLCGRDDVAYVVRQSPQLFAER